MANKVQASHLPVFLLLFSIMICLGPWFFVQAAQSINIDLAWLTTAAERFLSGGRMSEEFYDPNPPLSVLVQIVPAILSKYFHVPVYIAVFSHSLFLVGLSSWALASLLREAGCCRQERALLIMTYVLANTVLVGQYLGERDQYIMLGLLPFLLVQINITMGKKLSWGLKAGVLAAGSVAILIKPHYGLLPVLLLLHRGWRRSWREIFSSDFLALTLALIAYGLIILIFFPDYVTVILPDAISFYVEKRESWVVPLSVGLACVPVMFLIVGRLLFPAPPKKAELFMFLSLVCLIPFAVQGKGFYYHLLPALIAFLCGCALLLHEGLQIAAACLRFPYPATVLASFLFLSFAVYYAMPPNALYPTHSDYRKSELAQLIRKCGPDCTFFMLNDMTEMSHQLAVYTGSNFGSRFPSYWFLPDIINSESDQEFLAKKYARMVTEDFKRYTPDLVLIGEFYIDPGAEKPFDFAAFFSHYDPNFTAVWNHYRPEGSLIVNRRLYFGGTFQGLEDEFINYKIYRKTNKAL
jgi:hypothetical protein